MTSGNPILDELDGLSPAAKRVLQGVGAQMPAVQAAQAPIHSLTPPASPVPHLGAPKEPQAMPKLLSGQPEPEPPAIGLPPTQKPQLNMTAPIPVAPRGTQAGDEAYRTHLLTSGSGISQIKNTPLRGLARVGDVVGRLASNMFAPGLMNLIPGTEEHHNLLLNQANRQVGQDVAEQGKEAQSHEAEARAQALGIPPKPHTSLMQTPEGAVIINPDTAKAIPVTDESGNQIHGQAQQKTTRLLPVTVTVNGKQILANYDSSKGIYVDSAGNEIAGAEPPTKDATDAYHEWLKDPAQYEKFMKSTANSKAMQGAYGSFGPAFLASRMLNSAYAENPAMLPYLAPLLARMLQQPGDTPEQVGNLQNVLGQVPAGQPHNVEGSAIGLRQPESPTGATRSRGQFAEAIMPSIDSAKQEVQKLGSQLGPMNGRWYDMYVNKVGAYGPQFSQLQTNLKNIGTAWMRLHANSEGARTEFEGLLRSSRDPANLIANLNAIQSQARDYTIEGKGRPDLLNPQGNSGAQPNIGDVKTFPNGSKGKWDGRGWIAQ